MSKNKRIKQKWTDADRFAFATARLRASTIPNKRATASKRACRGKVAD